MTCLLPFDVCSLVFEHALPPVHLMLVYFYLFVCVLQFFLQHPLVDLRQSHHSAVVSDVQDLLNALYFCLQDPIFLSQVVDYCVVPASASKYLRGDRSLSVALLCWRV